MGEEKHGRDGRGKRQPCRISDCRRHFAVATHEVSRLASFEFQSFIQAPAKGACFFHQRWLCLMTGQSAAIVQWAAWSKSRTLFLILDFSIQGLEHLSDRLPYVLVGSHCSNNPIPRA